MKKVFYFLYIICAFLSANAQLPMNRYYSPYTIGSYIWDNTTSNGQIDNGTGTWNATNSTWVSIPSGVNLPWLNGTSATFGGNPGVGAAGTVIVSGVQNVKSLFFQPTPSGNFIINGATLNLQAGLFQTDQNATINTILSGNGINYIKRGLATLTIGPSNNNSITGNILISQGVLRLDNFNSAAGTTTISLGDNLTGNNNISLLWSVVNGRNISNPIIVNNIGTGTVTIGTYVATSPLLQFAAINSTPMTLNRPVTLFDTTNDRTTFTGIISGNPGTITIDGTATGTNTPRVTFENTGNTFIGKIIVKPNIQFQISGNTPQLNVVNKQPIEVNGIFYLNVNAGNTGIIGALSGSNSGICDINPVALGSPQTISVGNDDGSATYNGIIRNNTPGKVVRLIKNGTGIQLLTGTNTYSGPTTINNGALGGTGSLTASTTTINNNGRIMGGLGTGNSGTFTTSNLIFATASTAAIDVYSDGTILSKVQVNGTCNLGTTSKINLMESMPAGTFDIITSTGTMSGTNPTIGTNLSGKAASVSKSGNILSVTLL